MDKLFDIFNSKHDKNSNIYKNALNAQNKRIVFDHLDMCATYFKNIRIEEVHYTKKKNKKSKTANTKKMIIRLIDSRSKTGVQGFIVDIDSLKAIYSLYVEELVSFQYIPTYNLQQDVIEMFFGKIRACGGYNNNPNVHQFMGAYRKLLCKIKIEPPKYGNCQYFELRLPDNQHYSDVYFVSSSKRKVDRNNFDELFEAQKDAIIEEVIHLEAIVACEPLIDVTTNFSIATIAAKIELKILNCPRFYCNDCRTVFEKNDKINEIDSSAFPYKPCASTYEICKHVEKFMKVYDINDPKFEFKVLYCLIMRTIDIDSIYKSSNFACSIDHKYQFLKCIVCEYMSIKCTFISKSITLEQHEKIFRQHLNRMILFSGQ